MNDGRMTYFNDRLRNEFGDFSSSYVQRMKTHYLDLVHTKEIAQNIALRACLTPNVLFFAVSCNLNVTPTK